MVKVALGLCERGGIGLSSSVLVNASDQTHLVSPPLIQHQLHGQPYPLTAQYVYNGREALRFEFPGHAWSGRAAARVYPEEKLSDRHDIRDPLQLTDPFCWRGLPSQ
jgi:hypothetical protein